MQNDFLTKMFEGVIKDLQKNAEKFNQEKVDYENAMRLKVFIDNVHELEQVNQIMGRLSEVKHALTSERELKTHLITKAKSLGFIYDKTAKAFVKDNSDITQ